ncbi:hypothetical protein E3N88_08697 [Mikania micrantha]|uniref:Glycosyltransferase family 61 protein n=1 Tax=Mikania micrantha TaxID=192012 RepID=A0A5N6PIX2_9ASTR|nr:hypothetical protein E3N88_08697 [Mikania micrantha]
MVQKDMWPEKGRRGRLGLYATQILCVLFLFHLLCIELTFKGTPSQQIKLDILVTGRQILLDSKPVISSAVKKDVINSIVKKDDHNQSLQYLLTRLVGGEDRTKLETTGFACDNTSWSLMCVTNRPIKLDTATMQVHLHPSRLTTTKNTTTVVRPYSMQESPYVMNYITPVTITATATPPPNVTCDHNHQHPAVIFSSGGYTGNLFHEFNENIIPLFITTRLFESRMHFVVVDYKSSFINKYRRVFARLSDHPIINTAEDSAVHCFPAAVTGLKYHQFLGVNTSENPKGYYSMLDFRQFIMQTYKLKHKSVVMVGAHGAGLANELFLPHGAVMIQVRPLGFQWGTDSFYSEPGPGMGLKYLEYRIEPEESSLAEVYGLDHPVVRDTASVAAKGGYAAAREVYLDKQDLRLNLNRFRETLVEALGFIGHHKDVDQHSIS